MVQVLVGTGLSLSIQFTLPTYRTKEVLYDLQARFCEYRRSCRHASPQPDSTNPLTLPASWDTAVPVASNPDARARVHRRRITQGCRVNSHLYDHLRHLYGVPRTAHTRTTGRVFSLTLAARLWAPEINHQHWLAAWRRRRSCFSCATSCANRQILSGPFKVIAFFSMPPLHPATSHHTSLSSAAYHGRWRERQTAGHQLACS